jgi:hypothetical protein
MPHLTVAVLAVHTVFCILIGCVKDRRNWWVMDGFVVCVGEHKLVILRGGIMAVQLRDVMERRVSNARGRVCQRWKVRHI